MNSVAAGISAVRVWFTAIQVPRMTVMRILIASAFLLGMLFSSRLWWGDRLFPSLPVVAFLRLDGLTNLIAFALAGSLLGTCLHRRKIFPVVATVSAALLMSADQMRWQPWVYLYVLMLLPLAVDSTKDEATLGYYRLLLSGVYFWSGIHKLNPQFLDGNFQAFLDVVFHYRFRSSSDPLRVIGYGIGGTELFVGLSLLTGIFRRLALGCAVIMHAAIIAVVALADQFASMLILLPWNLAMILFDFTVFRVKTSRPSEKFRDRPRRQQLVFGFAIIVIWLMPALNFLDRWDHYLSFSLFSNKVPRFYVAVEASEASKVPAQIREFTASINGLSGGEIINVDLWARKELGVPFYPEDRTFSTLGKYFCSLGIEDRKVFFLRVTGPENDPDVFSTDCSSPDIP